MPSEGELPKGARRAFVEELHMHYRAARRPSLRLISECVDQVVEQDDLPGTASKETIRRMLQGQSVPSWATVEVVYRALCRLANTDPEATYQVDFGNSTRSLIKDLEEAWNRAVDEPPSVPGLVPAWPDEPPF